MGVSHSPRHKDQSRWTIESKFDVFRLETPPLDPTVLQGRNTKPPTTSRRQRRLRFTTQHHIKTRKTTRHTPALLIHKYFTASKLKQPSLLLRDLAVIADQAAETSYSDIKHRSSCSRTSLVRAADPQAHMARSRHGPPAFRPYLTESTEWLG